MSIIICAVLDFVCGNSKNRLRISKEKKEAIHIVLGGPSFKKSKEMINELPGDIMMANYIFTSEYAKDFPPNYWVTADPEYVDKTEFLNRLVEYSDLNSEFEVIVPTVYAKIKSLCLKMRIVNVRNVCIASINRVDEFMLRHNWMAPPSVNTAVFALYVAIQLGYETIYLHGCDLWVGILYGDKFNNIAHLPYVHSYGQNSAEEVEYCQTDNREGDNPYVYSFLECYMKVYLGLHNVADYAKMQDVKIYNMSENSLVDEFEKWQYK